MQGSLVQVGDRVEQDLNMMPGMGRLEQCHNYSLTVLPTPKVVASVYLTQCIQWCPQLLGVPSAASPLALGSSHTFTYIPGRDPPQDPQLLGLKGALV